MLKKEFSVIWQTTKIGIAFLIWLKRKAFIIAIFTMFASSSVQGAAPNATAQHCDSCPSNHFHEHISSLSAAATNAASMTPDCPENVQSIRQVMALSYGTCEALKPFDWALFKKAGTDEYFIENNGTFLKGYPSAPNCNYRENASRSCNHIDNYNQVKETHPYNRLDKAEACKNRMQCGGQPCLSTFALATESYAFHSPRNKEINIFAHKTKGHGQNGPDFLGWNCSEYVTTAMALAGRRLVHPNSDNCGGKKGGNLGEVRPVQFFPAAAYSDLADADKQSCSCLSTVDITDPNASIQTGDIITLDATPGQGHVMIVEAVEQPFFKDPSNIAECAEDKIRFDQLQIRLNHSSSTTAGPSSIQFAEYESLRYRQSLTYAVSEYIEECIEENNGKSDKKACWDDEGLQEQYGQYLFSTQQLNDSVGDMWKKTGQIFRSDEDRYPKWPKMRKYLSAVCKVRLYKKQGQQVPASISSDLNAMKEVFKVIRHQTEKKGCEVPKNKRPKLKHKECLGNCINTEANQCPTYGHQ